MFAESGVIYDMAAVDYSINYDDKRLTDVKDDESAALSDLEKTYAGMVDSSDKQYQALIDASEKWQEKQTEIQDKRTDFAIKEIEQNKAQAQKDYIKEQSGAYVDWQKQSDPYGANAEKMASQGLTNSGYSESAQVSMYNTYQNRITAARESFELAKQNYNNMIDKARMENNAAIAEIALTALREQAEYAIQATQYRNQLLLDQADKKMQVQANYWNRYQDVIKQMNTENALAEEVRQYNENMAFQKEQAAADKAYKDAQLALQREQFNWQKSQAKKSSSSGSSSSKKSSSTVKKDSGSSSSSGSNGTVSNNKNNSSEVDAYTVLNAMIKSGATKDKVSNEISLALRNGAITAKEAQELRSIFTPRGHQY